MSLSIYALRRIVLCCSLLWALVSPAWAAPWIGHLEIRDPQVWKDGRPGNYGTVKYYLDEVAGENVPIQVFVQVYGDGRPAADLEVQVFSNVNRRDQAKVWEDPAQAGGNDSYYLTYPMSPIGQTGNNYIYRAELTLRKTGAYRLTTRCDALSMNPTVQAGCSSSGGLAPLAGVLGLLALLVRRRR